KSDEDFRSIDADNKAHQQGQQRSSNTDTSVPLTSKEESHKELASVCNFAEPDQSTRYWFSVKNRLIATLGPHLVLSWFDRMKVKQISSDEVVMVAPTRFVASYCSTHFDERLLEAWRVVIPSIRKVRIVHGAG